MNIIHVTRPKLTAEERAKRMKAIREAAVHLVTETERQRRSRDRRNP